MEETVAVINADTRKFIHQPNKISINMNQTKIRIVAASFIMWVAMGTMAQTTVTHTVERGETIESIAKKYGVTGQEIIKANPDAKEIMFAGMKLEIPKKSNIQNNADLPKASSSNTILNNNKNEITYTQKANKTEECPNTKETNNYSGTNSITPENFNNYSIGYVAAFDDFGHGCYSLGFDIFSDKGFGMSFQGNANYGIVKSKLATLNFFLGPAYGYVVHPNIMLFTSLGAIMTASEKEKMKRSHDGSHEYKTTEQQMTWGVALRPQIVFRAGKIFPRVGIDIGWHELSKKVSASLNIGIGISI